MKKKRKISILIFAIYLLLFSTTFVMAAILFESWIVSNGNVSIGTVNKVIDVADSSKDNVEIESSTNTLDFHNAGDKKDFNITIKNRTDSIIAYQYEFSFDGPTFTKKSESYASCILVYFNGEFVDTLSNLCANSENKVESGYLDFTGYINKASNDNYSSQTDLITFELHSAADKSYFDTNTPFSFNLKAYAKTADYFNNIYVSNESDLILAVDDINSATFSSDAKIVLLNNVTLSQNIELSEPFILDLNGYELINNANITFTQEGITKIISSRNLNINSLSSTGSFILDNEKGLVDILDFKNREGLNIGYLYSNLFVVRNYDSTNLKDLIIPRLKNNLKYGVNSGINKNIFEALSFYNLNVTCGPSLSYTKPNLVSSNIDYTFQSYIEVLDEKIGVKIFGNNDDLLYDSLLENDLAYLMNLTTVSESGVIVNTSASDLFLPTSIKDKNVSITWKSSNEELMLDNGKISSDISGDEVVSLFATIKINDSIYTHEFKIRIMSQNHETIFQYFVAQLSPITIETMYNGQNSLEAYYFLPIVDPNYDVNDTESYSGYDYRSSYKTPENIGQGDSGYSWEAFSNIGFEYINYSLISTYNFIGLDKNAIDSNNLTSNAIYLREATFQTFAQISVTAKFKSDSEVYSGLVNILIDTGYNTELNELVFTKIQTELDEVDVLQNILDTRLENNMLNEKGDFYLDGKYQTYYITYEIPQSSQGAISEIIGYNDDVEIARISGNESFTTQQILQINRYKICLDPVNFEYMNYDFGITTILVMPTGQTTDTVSRIQYFECPAVIKPDSQGFSNISVFNSVKYQVWNYLATYVNNEVYLDDVENGDYTKLTDNDSFTISNNVITNHTGAYILRHDASLCKRLVFDLSESVTSTDNHIIYGLSKIIDWILCDSTDTFGTHFQGDISFDSSFINNYQNYASNGYSYINETEEEVIKNYFLTYISSDTSVWNNLWANISAQQKDEDGTYKYVLVDSGELNRKVNVFYSNTSTYGANRNSATIFKFQEVLQWAHNDKDFTDGTPNLGVIGLYDWENLIGHNYSEWTISRSGSYQGSKYNRSPYFEDETEYFSTYELEIILAFLLNSKTNSSSGPSNTVKAFVQNLRDTHFTIPRYFTSNGIQTLISTSYELLNKNVDGINDTGFSAEFKQSRIAGDTFIVPKVTLLDGSTKGFDYFNNLEELYIMGDYNGKLKAFHTTSNLTNFFNRVTSNNSLIKVLACEYCSDSNIDFRLENISKLENIEKIDLFHNQGISNIGALLKANIENLSYVSVADVDVLNEYSEFTLQAINYKSQNNPLVYFSLDGSTLETRYTEKLNSNAEGLIYLEEFYSLLAENAKLTQNVITENETTTPIQWVIETGNTIHEYSSSGVSIDTLNVIYTDYYFVTTPFTYNNQTFKANHLYYIYLDQNQNVAFSEIVDTDQSDLYIEIGQAPEQLPMSEVEAWAIANNIEKTTYEEESEHQIVEGNFTSRTIGTSSSNKPTNGGNSLFSRRTNVTFYDENGNELAQQNCYSIGTYLSNTRTNTEYWETYTIVNGYQGIIYKYYAELQSDGSYLITRNAYNIIQADSAEGYSYSKPITETWSDYYFSTTRTGFLSYTYSFKSVLTEYPTCRSFKYGNTTVNLTHTTNTGSPTVSGPQQLDDIDTRTKYSDEYLYTTLSLNATLYENIISTINVQYYNINKNVTYYVAGQEVVHNYNGTYKVSINSSGGFNYQQFNNGQSVINAKAMYNLLAEANSHLNDKKLGLYYHNYYAYTGDTFTYMGMNFIHNGVYYLDIGNDGKFYFAQSSNPNSQTFEEITGTYQAIIDLVANMDSTYEGKIYHYSGAANAGNTNGTNIWYIVMKNSETGSYELRKFGTVSFDYDVCSNAGTFSKLAVSLNANGLYSICNLMKYMDENLFSSGQSTTTYTYGVGGSRDCVLTAIVTGNDGVKYMRKFIITVIG